MKSKIISMAALALVLCFTSCHKRDTPPAYLDQIEFGNLENEKAHGLGADNSSTFKGATGLDARQFFADHNTTWRGGECTFTMKVDSAAQNYFTLLVDGQECCSNSLMLFINGKQIGYRTRGDLTPIYEGDSIPRDRMCYLTLPLPLSETQGCSEAKIGIRCFGPIDTTGVEFDEYQKPMTTPSIGIYRGYTHTTPLLTLQEKDLAVKAKEGVKAKPDSSYIKEIFEESPSLLAKHFDESQTQQCFYDIEQGCLMVKNGGEYLYAALHWRAYFAVNHLARLYLAAPACNTLATVYEDEARSYFCGLSYHRPDRVGDGYDWNREGYHGMFSANAGEKMLISRVPHGNHFVPGKASPYAGRLRHVSLIYGKYLMAMNCDKEDTYMVKIPAEFKEGLNLTDGNHEVQADSLAVAPRSALIIAQENQ